MLARSVILAAAIALSGCALDPQGGYRPIANRSGNQETLSFNEANARCWAVAMNIAGFGPTMAQAQAYDACMVRNGWADPRNAPQR